MGRIFSTFGLIIGEIYHADNLLFSDIFCIGQELGTIISPLRFPGPNVGWIFCSYLSRSLPNSMFETIVNVEESFGLWFPGQFVFSSSLEIFYFMVQ